MIVFTIYFFYSNSGEGLADPPDRDPRWNPVKGQSDDEVILELWGTDDFGFTVARLWKTGTERRPVRAKDGLT